jgi:hypothetical protein
LEKVRECASRLGATATIIATMSGPVLAEDRRKVSVYADPVVFERIVPLFEPMQRAAMTAVSPYSDEELVLLLDFLTRIREASLGAMTELRDSGPKADRKRRGRGRR